MFGITEDHRVELSRSIRGYVSGQEAFKHQVPEKERLLSWATAVEFNQATDSEMSACRHIASLPYVQPEVELSPIRFAIWCAAIVICNGCSFQGIERGNVRAIDAILREIR